MNIYDVVKYGNKTFLEALEGLEPEDGENPGAVGTWSIKDIASHIASFEVLLVEILQTLTDTNHQSAYLKQYLQSPAKFNDDEVGKRHDKTLDEVLVEYKDAYAKAVGLMEKISKETFLKNGTLPWYGNEYSLEDVIVYMYYGHKREHSAQIGIMRDRLKST